MVICSGTETDFGGQFVGAEHDLRERPGMLCHFGWQLPTLLSERQSQPTTQIPRPSYPHPKLHVPENTSSLPLRLLAGSESGQDSELLLESGQPLLKLSRDLCLVISELGVEVLAVGGGAHGGAEERLDDERVVRLERVAVGLAERVGELLGRVGGVVAEGLGGEFEAAMELLALRVPAWD